MRVRYIALFFFFGTLTWGVPVHAAVPEPFIYDAYLNGVPTISGAPYGTFQTALRTGNTPNIQVLVHSLYGTPSIVADLERFGLSQSATTSGQWVGYGARHYPAYFYNFGPISVSVDIPDGLYEIPITATNNIGSTSLMTMKVRVDNVPSVISLTNIEFSSDSPQEFDTIYLSGSANGTGSAMKVSSVEQYPLSATGQVLHYGYSSAISTPNMGALNDALASSTDGTFTRVPITLFWGGSTAPIETVTSLKIVLSAYDEAGYFASSTLIVSIPKPAPPDPCIAAGNCVSSVLFLPGIEGSRLYEGTGCGKTAEEKLWEPVAESFLGILRGAGDDKVGDLAQDASGASACSDIYVKEGDIVDTVRGSNIYASLASEMSGLKSDGTIRDWKPVAYDWRLSLDDLLNKGAERAGKIYYTEATSTPYIEQTLRALAAGSKTGKVSIVAHSNGGLLAKALLNRLGGSTATALVDKVIMVGVPQSGAPADVGSMLVGYNAGIYKYGFPIVSNAAGRAFTQNSPMAYHLLPSQNYFDSVMEDFAHPVARFTGNAYTREISSYGPVIGNLAELDDFLLAHDGGREKPAASDLSGAEVLNSTLLTYANSTHATLDAWTPPSGIEVNQIAGWGVETVGGVDFYSAVPAIAGPAAAVDSTGLDVEKKYKPILIEDGDGIVPVPSALMMASSTNVKRYWLNLDSYFRASSVKREHKDLFEIPSLQDFIKNILRNSTSTPPAYISSNQPSLLTNNKKLTFFLHSPLTLQLTDSSGNVTGIALDGSMNQDIPDSSYGEFGEVKYVSVPQGSSYELTLHGQASGTFSLDIQESLGGVVTSSSIIANVPTTENTLVSLTVSDGISTASSLVVDENGDGNTFTIAPVVGETVIYEPPAPETAPALIVSSGGGGVWASSPIIAPVATTTIATSTPPITIEETVPAAPSTQTVVTNAPIAIASNTKSLQMKRRTTMTPVTQQKKVSAPVSQTASAYDASQQQALKNVGDAVYYGLHRLWTGLQIIFHLK